MGEAKSLKENKEMKKTIAPSVPWGIDQETGAGV